MDEVELVRQCQRELPYSLRGYEALVRKYEAAVFSFCLGIVSNEADASEVTQDTFLRVFHHITKFEGRSSFKTWLYSIARNQSLTRIADNKRRAEREAPMPEGFEEQAVGQIGTEVEQQGEALAALAELGDEDREILTLRHIANMRLNEVAKTMGLGPSAAKMRYKRALERLMTEYERLSAAGRDPP